MIAVIAVTTAVIVSLGIVSPVCIQQRTPAQELLYASASTLQGRFTLSPAYATLEGRLVALQLDNPAPGALYPVALCCPAPLPGAMLGRGRGAKQGGLGAAAVLRLALWTRKPGGVLCLERSEVQVAPIALRVEQAYAQHVARSVQAFVGPYVQRLATSASGGCPELLRAADVGAAVAANTRLVSSHQVYVEFLYVAPIHLLVSFMPAPYVAAAHASTHAVAFTMRSLCCHCAFTVLSLYIHCAFIVLPLTTLPCCCCCIRVPCTSSPRRASAAAALYCPARRGGRPPAAGSHGHALAAAGGAGTRPAAGSALLLVLGAGAPVGCMLDTCLESQL